MSLKSIKMYAQYLLTKNNGDMGLTKKIVSNAANTSHEEGDDEAFTRETEVFQYLELLEAN